MNKIIRFDASSNNVETLINLMNSRLDNTERKNAVTLAHSQLTALFQQYQPSNKDLSSNYLTSLSHLNDDRGTSDIFYLSLLERLRESSIEERLLSNYNISFIETYLAQSRSQEHKTQVVPNLPYLPSINETQKALISAYLYFIFDDINELTSPVEIIKAFNLILSNTFSKQDKDFFVGKGKWESIDQLKTVLSHREPHKLLNLECKNDSTAKITKDAVVNFITSLVQQQIQAQKEESAKKIQKAYSHYRQHLFHPKPSTDLKSINNPALSVTNSNTK